MASVRKTTPKGGPRWQVRWRQDGRQTSESFATERQAITFRGLVDAAGQRYPEGWVPGAGFLEQPKEPRGLTLREWYPRAIAARPNAAADTKAKYLRMIELHVDDGLLDTALVDLTREQAGTWVAELLEDRSPKTVSNIHGAVSSCLKQAIADGHVERNVFVGLISRTERQTEPVFLERSEFDLLLTCVPELYQPLVEWLYKTGMRWGEATAVQWRDINFPRSQVDVRRAWKRGKNGRYYLGPPKTKRGRRTIALREDFLTRIKARYAGDPEGLVFPGARGGRIWHHSFLRDAWQPSVQRAHEQGLTKSPRIHDLRHSHASLLLSQGVPLLTVSRRMGHSSVAVTGDVYGHLEARADDAILRALGDQT